MLPGFFLQWVGHQCEKKYLKVCRFIKKTHFLFHGEYFSFPDHINYYRCCYRTYFHSGFPFAHIDNAC